MATPHGFAFSTGLTRRDRADLARAMCLGLSLVLGMGCARRAAPPLPLATIDETGPYRVQPGDMLDVKFLYHPTESQKLLVRADGMLALPITGDLEVGGLTVGEVEGLIRDRASRFLRAPVVSVTVVETGARAYVGGEVTKEGFVSLAKPMTPMQAILERGGYTEGADLTHVTVISKANGTPISREFDLTADADVQTPLTVLGADDIVYVPKTGIASANAWVARWIDGLTPAIIKNLRFPTF
jgi:protein involved in polysaccharide export with SLBB domain